MSKFKEFKKPFVLVVILLLVLIVFIANRIRTNSSISQSETNSVSISSQRFAKKQLDKSVLSDQKFKELKPIPKFQREGEIAVSDDDLANVKRRFSNPFKPF